MTVRRTSTTLTRNIAIVLFAGFLPSVKAYCWIDEDGYEHCDGLSTGARIGLGVGLWILFIAFLVAAIIYRRRRVARANLAFAQQNQLGAGNVYTGQPAYQPQYPPQAYGPGPGGVHAFAYDPNAGFSPPAGTPPQYYPPPPGAPPIQQNKGYNV